MNAKAVEPAPVAPVPPRERGNVAYLVGAVALVAAVAVLVMVFGVVRPPALPSLDAAGVTPPASIAWTQWDDRDDCNALMVARPDGGVDRLACERDIGDVVAWKSEGIISLTWGLSGQALVTWDATTGDVVTREAVSGEDYQGSQGSSVATFHRDGKLIVTLDAGGRDIWTVDAQSGYDVRVGATSPDGDWVAMIDSGDRLLLLRLNGDDGPVVWAEGVTMSWTAPVWEGTKLPGRAVDPKTQK